MVTILSLVCLVASEEKPVFVDGEIVLLEMEYNEVTGGPVWKPGEARCSARCPVRSPKAVPGFV